MTNLAFLLNTGVPLLFIEWYLAVLSLLIVVVLESYVYNRQTGNWKKSLKDIGIANVVTTVIGFPISNLVRFLFFFLLSYILPSSVFPNNDRYPEETIWSGRPPYFSFVEHLSILVFILLFNYLVSFYIEYRTLRLLNKQADKRILRDLSARMNFYSYALILICVIGQQVYLEFL